MNNASPAHLIIPSIVLRPRSVFPARPNLKTTITLCAMCLSLLISSGVNAQSPAERVPYGANPTAGRYLRVDDATIYYETYSGGGTPLVLLHGGLYGYIDEFGELIEQLSKHRLIIAVATRGHGKSELGTKPFSYALFAKDAFEVVRRETTNRVDVLGFSDGAITAYTLTAAHPELVRRLVAIGGPRKFADWTVSAQTEFKNERPGDVERHSPQFVAERKRLMPEPERWQEFIERLNTMWSGPIYVADEKIRSIKIPTLIVVGDHDPYNQAAKMVELFGLLPAGELSFIPGCGHVVLACNAPLTIATVEAFLNKQAK